MEAEMTNSGLDLQPTGVMPQNFIISTINPSNNQARFRFESHADGTVVALHKILKRLAKTYLPGKEHISAM